MSASSWTGSPRSMPSIRSTRSTTIRIERWRSWLDGTGAISPTGLGSAMRRIRPSKRRAERGAAAQHEGDEAGLEVAPDDRAQARAGSPPGPDTPPPSGSPWPCQRPRRARSRTRRPGRGAGRAGARSSAGRGAQNASSADPRAHRPQPLARGEVGSDRRLEVQRPAVPVLRHRAREGPVAVGGDARVAAVPLAVRASPLRRRRRCRSSPRRAPPPARRTRSGLLPKPRACQPGPSEPSGTSALRRSGARSSSCGCRSPAPGAG